MRASTKMLHQTLIRLLKGCLKAWETWLYKQPVLADTPEVDAPPSTSQV